MKDAKVLIVDDSKTTQIVVEEVLTEHIGIKNIHCSSNGLEAIEYLKGNEVDLIISDWNMPEMSGEEFLYEVKQNDTWGDTPFIMMTANTGRDFIITAIQLGVSDYIIKPCKPDELEAVVRKAWSKRIRRKKGAIGGLPPHALYLMIESKPVQATLLTINRSVAILRMPYDDRVKLFSEYLLLMSVRHPDFPDLNGEFRIGPIKGVVRRIEAEEALVHTKSNVCQVSFFFSTHRMEAKVETALNRLLDWLKSHGQGYIED